jgi:hypothetical protein
MIIRLEMAVSQSLLELFAIELELKLKKTLSGCHF